MTTMLSAAHISVARDGRCLIEDAGLDASAGEFIAVIGPNGAGKSTLLRALAGLKRLSAGEVRLGGANIAGLTPMARARALSYLPQDREIAWAMTVERVVALGRFAYGSPSRLGSADRAAVERALAATRLDALRGRIALSLSGGESARMHLARLLAAETPVLLADEPTAALDPRHQLEVMAILKGKAAAGGLVVTALHDLDLAQRHATRLIIMDRGRIIADGPPAQSMSAATLSGVFGVAAGPDGYRLNP